MMNQLGVMTLLETPNIGAQTIRLLQEWGFDLSASVAGLHAALNDLSRKNRRIQVPSLAELENAEFRARAALDVAQQEDIVVLTPSDPRFPIRLKSIKNVPVILFAKGNIECLAADASVAIIGTREPSDYGARLADKFGAMFAERSFVVVSGLAIGCDSHAHRGCLRAGGRTVAVMAHGLDMVYPASNRELATDIIARSGCLVSEYPPGDNPRRNYFIERDRLQSALSAGVVVVETDIKGGTMHTVGFCLDQGKPLACLAHPPKFAGHPKSNGNRYLISKGDAIPLSTPDDVASFASMLRPKSNESFDGISSNGPATTVSANDLSASFIVTSDSTEVLIAPLELDSVKENTEIDLTLGGTTVTSTSNKEPSEATPMLQQPLVARSEDTEATFFGEPFFTDIGGSYQIDVAPPSKAKKPTDSKKRTKKQKPSQATQIHLFTEI